MFVWINKVEVSKLSAKNLTSIVLTPAVVGVYTYTLTVNALVALIFVLNMIFLVCASISEQVVEYSTFVRSSKDLQYPLLKI